MTNLISEKKAKHLFTSKIAYKIWWLLTFINAIPFSIGGYAYMLENADNVYIPWVVFIIFFGNFIFSYFETIAVIKLLERILSKEE